MYFYSGPPMHLCSGVDTVCVRDGRQRYHRLREQSKRDHASDSLWFEWVEYHPWEADFVRNLCIGADAGSAFQTAATL